MSVSKWAYDPDVCDGDFCVGDCDLCPKAEEGGQAMKGSDLIKRGEAIEEACSEICRCTFAECPLAQPCSIVARYLSWPAVDAVEVPETGIGDLSDGYHTFNGLYHQRMILFAALVKAYKDRAWKSFRHEDGELCFGGGWFIVGIDTPEGSYTYHYESKDFDLFDCDELPVGKHWDGHTEDDVTRLLSLPVDAVEVVRCRECVHRDLMDCRYWEFYGVHYDDFCSRGQRREDGDA